MDGKRLAEPNTDWEMVHHNCYWQLLFHIIHYTMMSDRWYCSLKQEVYPVRFVSVGETLSHPPVVFGFHPCGQFKDPWSLKSSKRKWVKVREREREMEKKNWASLKEDFVFWWLALPERVSLGRQRGAGCRLKGSGGRDVNYGFGEKEAAKVCWGPSLWHHHGPFSGSTALRPQRGDFFIYLFNFMPCRPQNGPIPSPKMPRPPLCGWLPQSSPPKTLNGDIVFSLLLFSLG